MKGIVVSRSMVITLLGVLQPVQDVLTLITEDSKLSFTTIRRTSRGTIWVFSPVTILKQASDQVNDYYSWFTNIIFSAFLPLTSIESDCNIAVWLLEISPNLSIKHHYEIITSFRSFQTWDLTVRMRWGDTVECYPSSSHYLKSQCFKFSH